MAAVCLTDEQVPKVVTSLPQTLFRVDKDDLRAFGENFRGIRFADKALKSDIIDRLLVDQAIGGTT